MSSLKVKNVKARIEFLRVLPYKGTKISLRMIDRTIFEWLFIFNNEIYTGNIIITLKKGSKTLSEQEIQSAAALVWACGKTTVDTLLGQTVDGSAKEHAQKFIDATKKREID